MNIVVFEDAGWRHLLPLTWLRPAFELRCGRDGLLDRIRTHVDPRIVGFRVRAALAGVLAEIPEFTYDADLAEAGCLINGRALITEDVTPPAPGCAWVIDGTLVAATMADADELARIEAATLLDPERFAEWAAGFRAEPPPPGVRLIRYPWDLIAANAAELARQISGGGVRLGEIHAGAHLLNPDAIHVGEGARIRPGVVLDAASGPIEIAAGALIEPNAVVQGPCYVGEKAIVRPGAVLREGTSIGPVCKVGGEIEGSLMHGYCNKQHDGFLGHSYVCPWANLGADTVTSDLKNTYGAIRVSLNGVPVESGQRFLGSTIGDHAKTGIGTILPTGCIVGVAANVFAPGAIPKFVPSFSWLTHEGMTAFREDKALQIAETVMSRRNVALTPAYRSMMEAAAREAKQIEAAGWADGARE